MNRIESLIGSCSYPFLNVYAYIYICQTDSYGFYQNRSALEFQEDLLIWHTHNAWLIAFYFAATRISDVVKLKWSDFKDNRLNFVMSKNEKALSLKVSDKAKTILEKYRNYQFENNGYIFPFLKDAK